MGEALGGENLSVSIGKRNDVAQPREVGLGAGEKVHAGIAQIERRVEKNGSTQTIRGLAGDADGGHGAEGVSDEDGGLGEISAEKSDDVAGIVGEVIGGGA